MWRLAAASPVSPEVEEALDVVDRWRLTCAGERTLTLYHNLYRCGSPCPPQGTKLLPAEAYRLYIDSYKAYDAGRGELALQLAEQAYVSAPGYELLALWAAIMNQDRGLLSRAIALYEAVLTINPEDVFSLVQQAILYNALDRVDDALVITTSLLDLLDTTHPSYPDTLCAHATALRAAQPLQAKQFAEQACQAGVTACC